MMRSLVLAPIVLGCSMGIALAQSPAPPAPPTPEQEQILKALVAKRAAAVQNGVAVVGAAQTGSKAPNAHLGWNFAHATNCGWFGDNTGGQWFYIFPPAKDGGGIVFTINNLYVSQGLQVSCSQGNWFAWHVIDTNGDYDQTQSYDFK